MDVNRLFAVVLTALAVAVLTVGISGFTVYDPVFGTETVTVTVARSGYSTLVTADIASESVCSRSPGNRSRH